MNIVANTWLVQQGPHNGLRASDKVLHAGRRDDYDALFRVVRVTLVSHLELAIADLRHVSDNGPTLPNHRRGGRSRDENLDLEGPIRRSIDRR